MQETWFYFWIRKIRWRRNRLPTPVFLGFPCGSTGKESACNEGDWSSIPGLGRYPWRGKGYPLQYSGLENSMDCIVHRLYRKESDTPERLSFSLSVLPRGEGAQLLSCSKANKQARLVERKVCFFSDASFWYQPLMSTSRGSKRLYRQKEGATCRNSIVIFILVISGLSSIISIVLGTVNLQFQVSLFPFFWVQFS